MTTNKKSMINIDKKPQRKQDRHFLKVDLDIKSKSKAIKHLIHRLTFLHLMSVLSVENIAKIELIKKSSYSVRITTKNELVNVDLIVIIQLLLGSDYKKEAHTIRNFYVYGFQYFNRLFSYKCYSNNEVISSQFIDITQQIIPCVITNIDKFNQELNDNN